jgi:hypothetical protein
MVSSVSKQAPSSWSTVAVPPSPAPETALPTVALTEPKTSFVPSQPTTASEAPAPKKSPSWLPVALAGGAGTVGGSFLPNPLSWFEKKTMSTPETLISSTKADPKVEQWMKAITAHSHDEIEPHPGLKLISPKGHTTISRVEITPKADESTEQTLQRLLDTSKQHGVPGFAILYDTPIFIHPSSKLDTEMYAAELDQHAAQGEQPAFPLMRRQFSPAKVDELIDKQPVHYLSNEAQQIAERVINPDEKPLEHTVQQTAQRIAKLSEYYERRGFHPLDTVEAVIVDALPHIDEPLALRLPLGDTEPVRGLALIHQAADVLKGTWLHGDTIAHYLEQVKPLRP